MTGFFAALADETPLATLPRDSRLRGVRLTAVRAVLHCATNLTYPLENQHPYWQEKFRRVRRLVTVGDVREATDRELLAIPGLGRVGLRFVREAFGQTCLADEEGW